MLRALSVWLYGGDPFSILGFEESLQQVRERFLANPEYAQSLVQTCFLQNMHRVNVIMEPDPDMAGRLQQQEHGRLQQAAESLSDQDREKLSERTHELRALQQKPDPPEALATLPRLKIEDLPRKNQLIPCEQIRIANTTILRHDLFTNGILYCDIGLNLHLLPQQYLPFVPLFSRALLETGAGTIRKRNTIC